jgi:hypothetical protein
MTAFLTGCATSQRYVISATGTIIGVEIAQNPQSQMYQAKLGYNRSELAFVPTNTNTHEVPNVIMELRYSSIFSLTDAGIYQRLAVGTDAVKQPGAAFMFAKAKDGTLSEATATAVSKSIQQIQTPVAAAIAPKAQLARAFMATADKAKFETAAQQAGFLSFSTFLRDVNTSPAKVEEIRQILQAAGALP